MMLNWNAFGLKHNNYEQKAFENLSYELFCLEKENTIGLHRYFNQPGIETMPIDNCGFQAKYYTNGFQSLVPLYIVSKYLSDSVKVQANNSNKMSSDEIKRFEVVSFFHQLNF